MTKLFAELMEKQLPATSEQSEDVSVDPQDIKPASAPEVENDAPAVGADLPQAKATDKPKMVKPINIATREATYIAILQLTKEEIDELRETAFKNQTFRFSEDELNWLRDRSYGLTRALGRKVAQGDLLRLSLKTFRKLVADNQTLLEEMLDAII